MTTAAQAAAELRKNLKKLGHNPKGRVRVISNDYITEVEVDTRGISEDDMYEAMRDLPDNVEYTL